MLTFSSSLLLGVLAALLIGLILAIRRMMVGFAIVGGVALGYSLYSAFRWGWMIGTEHWILLGIIAALTALGLGIEAITSHFRLRMGWIGQNTVWGGLIGGMIGLFLLGGAFWMLLGTLAGTILVQFSGSRGMQWSRAFIDGLEGFFAMFGSAGLRVLLAVVIIDLFLDFAVPAARFGF